MGNGRLRWLTRHNAESLPSSRGASERLVPVWLEALLGAVARTPADARAWTEVVSIVRQVTGAEVVRIWSLTAPGQLHLVAAEGLSSPSLPERSTPEGLERCSSEEQVTGDPAQLRPSALLSEQDLSELRREGIVQVLALPLCTAGRIVGRLELGRRRAEPFSREERAVVSVLAPVLACSLAAGVPSTLEAPQARAESLLAQALANAVSAREALVRLCEALRWQGRADVVLLVRWQREDRPELVVAAGDAVALPDPAALSTPRVAAVLRGLLAGGSSVQWSANAEIALLFPREVAAVLAVPLPISVEQARGLVIVAWHREPVEEAARVRALLEELVPSLVGLLVWFSEQEQALVTTKQAHWLEEMLVTLLGLSDPESLSRLVWHVLSREQVVLASALAVVQDNDLYWFWVVDGRPVPVRRLPVARVPFAGRLSEQRSVLLGVDERGQWQVVLPSESPAGALLAVPFSSMGALVVAAERVEPLHRLEPLLQRVAALLARVGAELRQRVRLAATPDQRGRALLDVLLAGESERRELVETIHTAVLQGLASTLYRIELTLRRADQQALEQTVLELEQVRDQLAEQIAILRDAVFRLRPASLEHLGLVAALREYLAQLERARGIAVDFLGELPARLRPDIEEVLYRIVQTLIERARLPMGVQRLVVRLRQQRDGSLLLVVADDGEWVGDEAWLEQPGIALVEEWVRLLGGTVRATGLSGAGTTVAITLRPEAVPPLTRVPIGTIR